ncbi:MAG: tetratricopeptide repeat protein [Synergistaceae bacterium]|nr:tetratricopeptide repeat protein [Synergistaceae bacterium]
MKATKGITVGLACILIAGVIFLLPPEGAFASGHTFGDIIRNAEGNPGDLSAQAALAREYNRRGEYGKALSVAKAILEESPGFPEAIIERAHAHRSLGEYRKSVEWYRRYLGTNPGSLEGWGGLSESLAHLEAWDESFGAARAAIGAAPQSPDGYGALGRAYRIAGRFEEAADLLKQGLRFGPERAPLLYDLGVCYVELGDRPSALSQYEKLLSVDQRSADRLFNLIFP